MVIIGSLWRIVIAQAPLLQYFQRKTPWWSDVAEKIFQDLKFTIFPVVTLWRHLDGVWPIYIWESDTCNNTYYNELGTLCTWMTLQDMYWSLQPQMFMEQHVTTEKQQRWASKLLMYDCEIIYQKKAINIVVYLLSRQFESSSARIFVCNGLTIEIWVATINELWTLIEDLRCDPTSNLNYTCMNDELRYNGHWIVSSFIFTLNCCQISCIAHFWPLLVLEILQVCFKIILLEWNEGDIECFVA